MGKTTVTQQPDLPPHANNADAVLLQLGVTSSGLSSTQAASRQQQFGLNHLPEAPRPGLLRRFLAQFNNLLIIVLLVAAAVTGLLGHWLDTAVILVVVLVNTVLGLVQEGKAEKAMLAIRDMLAPSATVLRDGQRVTLAAEQLVPGDIVLLEAGDKVPADLRLLQANTLSVQEAILTGESLPVEKNTTPVPARSSPADQTCTAFSGTLVATGQGLGVVVASGAATELGRISHMMEDLEPLATPLLQQITRLSRGLTGIILVAASMILLWGYFSGQMPFSELFVAVVGLSVASIPEGLPAVLTVTLALGVQAMARRNAIVRKLPAIETLGSVSVICTDKTGTLTRNEMMVATLACDEAILSVDGDGYAPVGEFRHAQRSVQPLQLQAPALLLQAAALCNDAVLTQQNGHWTVLGDPMEGALLSAAAKAGLTPESVKTPRLHVLPFDARHRYMATLHQNAGRRLIFVKGAPEAVISRCASQLDASGSAVPLDQQYWHQQIDQIAADGQRVLGFAVKYLADDHNQLDHEDVAEGLILLGLAGLIDPPRPEAIAAIAECYRAGIQVKMITGDHAGTATAIGRQIGLKQVNRVLTGADIEQMDDAALASAVTDVDVFARTSPEHKLRLVGAFQSQGLVVAMTGDGVNDAPALKRADVGIAMGQKGSEAAKQAAQLVLADDNFASIVLAVSAGRTVYDNVRKIISFLLPINGGESLSLVIAILFGLTLPITAGQILWVNMVSSVALGLALAFEPAESGVMNRPPRPAGEAMIPGVIIWRIVLVSVLFTAGVFGQFVLAQYQGATLEVARTMAVNTLVAMEVFYLFSVRYSYGSSITFKGLLGTPAVLYSISAVTIFQLIFTYTPWMALAFESRPLGLMQLVQVTAFGLLVLLAIEIDKWVLRRF
ncbi:MAG: HAD-IC family P-type ATPase [Gammaproteobacteria bacterium]|nr:HAD-IC family P-type ATPase [Gammaproteobacteria bacterium]